MVVSILLYQSDLWLWPQVRHVKYVQIFSIDIDRGRVGLYMKFTKMMLIFSINRVVWVNISYCNCTCNNCSTTSDNRLTWKDSGSTNEMCQARFGRAAVMSHVMGIVRIDPSAYLNMTHAHEIVIAVISELLLIRVKLEPVTTFECFKDHFSIWGHFSI